MCHLLSVFSLATTPLTAMPATDEQLKKKPDTSAIAPVKEVEPADSLSVVSETPATYITAKKEEPAEQVKEAAPVEKPAEAEKPKVFIPNASASASVKIPSLKDVGKTPEEVLQEDDPYLKGDAKEDFTFDDFLKLWNTHAANVKAQGKMSLFTIFISEVPKMLSPNVFEIVVENKVQENDFKNEKPVLLNYLRSTLKNFDIDVITRIEESKVVKRPYTSQEKFNHMAAKNPQLIELKKRFNLDFD
jgi:DNA polymerase-3 subunit gamma/tau